MIARHRGAASTILSLVSCLLAAPASAAPKPVVEIDIAAAAEEEAAIEHALREVEVRLGVTIESRAVAAITPSIAGARPGRLLHVDVDAKAAAATITVVDGQTGRRLATRQVLRTDSEDVFYEELSLVIEAAIEPSILAERDRRVGVLEPAPVATPPSTAPVPDQRRPPTPFGLDLEAFGGASSFGPAAATRAGAGATLASRRGLRPALSLSAAYLVPFDSGIDPVLTTSGAALRLRPELTFIHSDPISLGAHAGVGVDLLHAAPRATDPSTPPSPATTRANPIISLGAQTKVALGGRFSLALLLGADIDLATRRYVVERGPDRAEVFSPARVRPVALLGITVSAIGEPLFATPSTQVAQ